MKLKNKTDTPKIGKESIQREVEAAATLLSTSFGKSFFFFFCLLLYIEQMN